MPSLPPSAAPASYIAYQALAIPVSPQESAAVSHDNPLPVTQRPSPAASTPLEGSASSSSRPGPFLPDPDKPIWLTLSGSWAGTATLRRSSDGGITSHPLTAGGEDWGRFSSNACEAICVETESGAEYYLDIALTSGTLAYRVSQ